MREIIPANIAIIRIMSKADPRRSLFQVISIEDGIHCIGNDLHSRRRLLSRKRRCINIMQCNSRGADQNDLVFESIWIFL